MAKKKDFTGDPGGLIGDAIFSAIKPLYKEAKRQERAARAPRKTYYAPIPKTYIKDIVFEVLPQAIRNAGANFNAATSTTPRGHSPTATPSGRSVRRWSTTTSPRRCSPSTRRSTGS